MSKVQKKSRIHGLLSASDNHGRTEISVLLRKRRLWELLWQKGPWSYSCPASLRNSKIFWSCWRHSTWSSYRFFYLSGLRAQTWAKKKYIRDKTDCAYAICPYCKNVWEFDKQHFQEETKTLILPPNHSWHSIQCIKIKFNLNGGENIYCLAVCFCECGQYHLLRHAYEYSCPRCRAKFRMHLPIGLGYGCDKNWIEGCQGLLTYLAKRQIETSTALSRLPKS